MVEKALGDVAGEVTQLLAAARSGQTSAWGQIYRLLYRDLRNQARAQLGRSAQQTLSPTALINEAWIRLSGIDVGAENRRQLIALCITAMRSVIVDQTRRKLREKRGGGMQVLSLSDGWDSGEDSGLEQLVELDAALAKLSKKMPHLATVVEWRYFGGLSEEEISRLLDVNVRKVRRDWLTARAFLLRALG
ncbi:ECF-type sigma factor [Pseudoxanthomonas sp.]|uniref:ECF-type sigma factor n=1 Tax=Pseudoxanthomonas sp. TaxID=1871049 RepID=UPI002FDFD92C